MSQPEASKEQLWQWLTEAEDQLEITVSKYNDLVEQKEKLDRREFVREILIRQLRQDARRGKQSLETSDAILWALEVKERNAKREILHLKNELSELRVAYDGLARRLTAKDVLLEHERRKSNLANSRTRELLLGYSESGSILRDAKSTEVQAIKQSVTSSATQNHVENTKLKEELDLLLSEKANLFTKLENLENDKEKHLGLINEQSEALSEWQEAYTSLEKEVTALKEAISAQEREHEVVAELKVASKGTPSKGEQKDPFAGVKALVQNALAILSKL